tara:strand:+ start:171 stop:710 length:540 start_codon:yes stop_codon:yes gene_type:complete
MSEKIVVPALGESIIEATVAKWLKNQGDTVEADEPIVELETDKVNLEVPSPVSGILGEIRAQDGEIVKVGSVLGLISKENVQPVKQEIKKILPKNQETNVVNLDTNKKEETIEIFEDKMESSEESKDEPLVLESEDEPLVLTNEVKTKRISEDKEIKGKLSPAVRKMVVENKIDFEKIE